MTGGTKLDPADFTDKYEQWIEFIEKNHNGSNPREPGSQQFTPLKEPLSESKVALIGSGGVHRDDQEPFHIETTAGDPTFRVLADDTDLNSLRFTHTHYDTAPAEADPNVVFPLDRLHEAAAEGRIGETSSVHIGMMGFNPDPTPIAEETAPAVAEVLANEGVDVVVLVPG